MILSELVPARTRCFQPTLGSDGQPEYNHEVARHLVSLGMPVAAMTPLKLAEWISLHVRGGA